MRFYHWGALTGFLALLEAGHYSSTSSTDAGTSRGIEPAAPGQRGGGGDADGPRFDQWGCPIGRGSHSCDVQNNY